MIDRKPMTIACKTGKSPYPRGEDPESMAVQMAHDVWRWYRPEEPVGPKAEPFLRNWAQFVVRVYRAAAEHKRKAFVIRVTLGPDNLPFMQVVG